MKKHAKHSGGAERELFRLLAACRSGNLARVRNLVAKGVPVNSCGGKVSGYFPIHAASENGNEAVVGYLLKIGADPNVRTSASIEQRGDTPLLLAVRNGHLKVVRLLVRSGADVNQKSFTGTTTLGNAIRSGRVAVFNFLLKHRAEILPTHPRTAIERGEIKMYRTLAKLRPQMIKADKRWSTLLNCAVVGEQLRAVRELIKDGAEINEASPPYGEPPLLTAVGQCKTEIAEYLLQHGADPNQPSTHGVYCLTRAVDNDDVGMARRLIAAGARVNVEDFEQKTPLIRAIDRHNKAIFQLLVQSGAEVPARLRATVVRRFGKNWMQ